MGTVLNSRSEEKVTENSEKCSSKQFYPPSLFAPVRLGTGITIRLTRQPADSRSLSPLVTWWRSSPLMVPPPSSTSPSRPASPTPSLARDPSPCSHQPTRHSPLCPRRLLTLSALTRSS